MLTYSTIKNQILLCFFDLCPPCSFHNIISHWVHVLVVENLDTPHDCNFNTKKH